VNNFVTVLLQSNSGICVPKIIKIEHDLTKLLRNKMGAVFFASQCRANLGLSSTEVCVANTHICSVVLFSFSEQYGVMSVEG